MRKKMIFFAAALAARNVGAACLSGYSDSAAYKIVGGADCGTGWRAAGDSYKFSAAACDSGWSESKGIVIKSEGESFSDAVGSYTYVCVGTP